MVNHISRKTSILIITLCAFYSSILAQSISGTVANEEGEALRNVSVIIPALHCNTDTNNEGNFSFKELPKGFYTIEFRLIGYKKETREINLTKDTLLAIILKISPLELPAVTVTAEPQPTTIQESPLSATVIEAQQLERERGQSLAQTIELAPGVAVFSGGPFSAKPVIRGLTAQRVLVLSNGVRVESQTWDEPQSLEINILDVDRIEIVRGPNSVLYGSDALGGVVNVLKSDFRFVEEGKKSLGGIIRLNVFSNNNQVAGSISLDGANGTDGYRGNFSVRTAGDYSTPAGTTANGKQVSSGKVFNSGGNEINGSVAIATREAWGTISLDATHVGQKFFISPEPGRKEYEFDLQTGRYDSLPAAPHQEINHDRVGMYANVATSLGRLELNIAAQRNSRKEEGVEESEEDEEKKESLGIKPDAELILTSYSLETKLHHQPVGKLFGTAGLSIIYQTNETFGQRAIIPAFVSLDAAAFFYEEYRVTEEMRVVGGLRYDTKQIQVDANPQLGNPDQTLNFDALTGTLGISWTVTEPLTFALNVGRGWRTPVAAELFFNGVDEGTVRYRIGESRLTPEKALNVDFAIRYTSSVLEGECSLFRNQITNYIFLAPTGQKINGLDSYKYRQSDATLLGGELSFQAKLADWLVVSAGADIVRGTHNETDSPLPLIPADRVKADLRLLKAELLGMSNAHCILRSKVISEQSRNGLFETPTPGYSLFDMIVGGEMTLDQYHCMFDFSIENIFDEAYYDHLNRYKNYALNPGRNITLKISVPFEIFK